MKKTIRNIGLAALLGTGIASAPSIPVSNYSAETIYISNDMLSPDIYGKGTFIKYEGTVPDKDIYKMINRAMYWNPGPDYADARYHRAITYVESTDDPEAESPAGAKGLRQNTRIAWESVTKEDYDALAFNPQASITVGIKYTNDIHRMLSNTHPRWRELSDIERRDLNTAANNGGITRLIENGFDISKMPAETRNYVEKVNNYYDKF